MLESYREHVKARAALGIPPLPLNAEQTAALCELLKNPPEGEAEYLMHLLCDRIPPGVDPASYAKASFLTAIVSPQLRKWSVKPAVYPIAASWDGIIHSWLNRMLMSAWRLLDSFFLTIFGLQDLQWVDITEMLVVFSNLFRFYDCYDQFS